MHLLQFIIYIAIRLANLQLFWNTFFHDICIALIETIYFQNLASELMPLFGELVTLFIGLTHGVGDPPI